VAASPQPPFVLLPAVDIAGGLGARRAQDGTGTETSHSAPVEAALAWQDGGAPWVHLVDLDAAFGRGTNLEVIAEAVGRLDVRGTTLSARGWAQDGGELFDVLARLDAGGCARYVLTNVRRDGALTGPNLDLLRDVCAATDRPVIARGGVSSLDDLRALASLGPAGVEGAIVGKALYAGAFTLPEAIAAVGLA
jgi:phosphoribosylanthranilate isomerase